MGQSAELSPPYAPCYTANMVGHENWQDRWITLGRGWQHRLEVLGLGAVIGAFGELSRPLAPLAVQLLWFFEPGFEFLGQGDALRALAGLLDGTETSQGRRPQGEEP